jgi:hypothetical protein
MPFDLFTDFMIEEKKKNNQILFDVYQHDTFFFLDKYIFHSGMI